MRTERGVTIVGAGMAGAACAVALRAAGVEVRVLDRGRVPGGRMSSPALHDRRVDLGAGYFTVRDKGFAELVARWDKAGLVHRWTDTFAVFDAGEPPRTSSGPTRWGTPAGLRSLVRELLSDIEVTSSTCDTLPSGDVVVAMPDPQAARLLAVPDAVDYQPVIAVACGYRDLGGLPFTDAAFVNGHPHLSFVAHDGARRGDGAPVLVAHTTGELAAAHLAAPDDVAPTVTSAVSELFDIDTPDWTHVHRWTFAKPVAQHESSHHLSMAEGRLIGLAGDQWCPQGAPRVESAWRSGTDLAAAIVAARS
ncbi:NAD(P)/FAD-dependent oxidoreductase [Williamsia sp. CHRR-6]|uniref:NAD(P)/FAD-dependent oxidoreductase n=1 Tax=Williamsia sp. CHRR-6 TaxID=2835871 RepID=UPI001BD9850C|nr:NAD(P)-binding protein [Williamsia sp. CHRR-6]MBT0565851.1 NAD(P)-binding protein [Williamsia sp. CHRR-6]